MDLDELDDNLSGELRKLTREQLEEVAQILYERTATPHLDTPAVLKDPHTNR
jgi:hypothetical protein